MFWDLDGGIRDANDAFLSIVGYERADLVSGRLRWSDLTPAEWLERDREIVETQVRSTGRVPPYEKEFFRKDGSRVPVLIGGAAFDDEVKHGVAFVLDITARKRAEEAMLQQKAHLDELFDLAPDAIVLTTIRDPANVRINREFTRMFGYTAEEAVGRRLRDLIAPPDVQPANLTENADLLAGRTVQKEVIRQRKDGSRFHAVGCCAEQYGGEHRPRGRPGSGWCADLDGGRGIRIPFERGVLPLHDHRSMAVETLADSEQAAAGAFLSGAAHRMALCASEPTIAGGACACRRVLRWRGRLVGTSAAHR